MVDFDAAVAQDGRRRDATNDATNGGGMYKSIVVGSDGSSTAMSAVREAARLAKATGASVHLVGAYQAASTVAAASAGFGAPTVAIGMDAEDEIRRLTEEHLRRCADELSEDGIQTEVYAVPAPPATAILDVAQANDSDLIVVGSRGMTGARRVLGSVPNSVAHHAPCSVLIVKTC
jgi:nucleotide-binding universal stress UspA family protein